MKNLYRLIAIFALLTALAGCAQSVPIVPTNTPNLTPPSFDTLIPLAKQFVSELSSGNYNAAFDRFDINMKASMTLAKLQTNWQHLLTIAGAFQQQTGTTTAFLQGKPVVSIACDFARGSLSILLAFNSNSEIVGLNFSDLATGLPAPSTF
jgi:hypothetical protein